jgi:hypothetical protein
MAFPIYTFPLNVIAPMEEAQRSVNPSSSPCPIRCKSVISLFAWVLDAASRMPDHCAYHALHRGPSHTAIQDDDMGHVPRTFPSVSSTYSSKSSPRFVMFPRRELLRHLWPISHFDLGSSLLTAERSPSLVPPRRAISPSIFPFNLSGSDATPLKCCVPCQ